MNLVLAETFITFFGLPIDFTAIVHFGWKMGKSLCVLTGFILSTSGTENCKDRKIAKFNLHFHLYGHFYNMQIGKILALADFAA